MPVFKEKVDPLVCGSNRAIKLLEQPMNVHERVLEKRIRRSRTMFFVDLEKAFDRVPREVVRWALRKLGGDEWLGLQ